jgi:hypothetical protein
MGMVCCLWVFDCCLEEHILHFKEKRTCLKIITNIIPLYNIYSTYIEIRLVETIPRDVYQNIVFPSQQHSISLLTISYFPYSKFSRFNALVI